MRNNNGFTLIELVLVVTIIATMSVVTTIGLVSSTGRRDDDATITSLSNLLESSRFNAMSSKNKSFLARITYDESDGYHFQNITGVDTTDVVVLNDNKIGGTKRIFYLNEELDSGEIKVAHEIDTLDFEYDKATGSFKALRLIDSTGSEITITIPNDNVLTLTTENYKKKCVLAQTTGRTFVE